MTVLLSNLGAACADSPVEPDMPFTVSFSHGVTSQGWNVETFRHECLYTVSAQASGGPEGAFAVWDQGDLEILFTDEAPDSTNLQAIDIWDYWGRGRITTGELLETSRIAWGASSFELAHTFTYSDWRGRAASQTVFIDCTSPSPTGSIVGTVTIDGLAAEGITLTLSSGEAATTDAVGGYAIDDIPLAAYRVTISVQPSDVVFPTTTQIAVIVMPDQMVSVNFGGTRK